MQILFIFYMNFLEMKHVVDFDSSCILYFIPYSVDQLGYLRMLYTAGAFYTHRMLMPILLLGILSDIEKGKKA